MQKLLDKFKGVNKDTTIEGGLVEMSRMLEKDKDISLFISNKPLDVQKLVKRI
jgi:hypothetical protein